MPTTNTCFYQGDNMSQQKIPEGYRKNANGDLVLLTNIKEIDLIRDELVVGIAERAKEKSGELAEFRTQVMDEIQGFVAQSADRFKAKMGGAKGNLSLFSFDGRFKVQVANQDFITFDERLQVAKALIDKCIKKWSEGADAKLMALVNDAFQVDKAGNVSIRRVLGLRQMAIEDRDWKKAMEAISESVKVTDSKSYLRVYERSEGGEYRPVSLDVANA
jgi:pectate lyase